MRPTVLLLLVLVKHYPPWDDCGVSNPKRGRQLPSKDAQIAGAIDNFALVLKGLFLISGYLVILLSMNYIGEGDYWEGEYYQLIIASVLGMMVMASARDLISIFIALELL